MGHPVLLLSNNVSFYEQTSEKYIESHYITEIILKYAKEIQAVRFEAFPVRHKTNAYRNFFFFSEL